MLAVGTNSLLFYLVGELFDSPLILAYSLLILLAFLLLGFQVILQFFHLPVTENHKVVHYKLRQTCDPLQV